VLLGRQGELDGDPEAPGALQGRIELDVGRTGADHPQPVGRTDVRQSIEAGQQCDQAAAILGIAPFALLGEDRDLIDEQDRSLTTQPLEDGVEDRRLTLELVGRELVERSGKGTSEVARQQRLARSGRSDEQRPRRFEPEADTEVGPLHQGQLPLELFHAGVEADHLGSTHRRARVASLVDHLLHVRTNHANLLAHWVSGRRASEVLHLVGQRSGHLAAACRRPFG
jgi:hypothetical protein